MVRSRASCFPTLASDDEEFLKNAPMSILPSLFKNGTFDFLDLDNVEIARQLALIEFAIFKCVQVGCKGT